MSLFDFNLYDLLEYSDVIPSEEELKKMGMTWSNYIEKHRDELREKKRIQQEQQQEWLAQHPIFAEYYSQLTKNIPQELVMSKQDTVVVTSEQESIVLTPKQVKSPQQVSLMEEEGTLTQMSMDSESLTEEDPVTIDAPLEMQLVDNTTKQNISEIPHFDLWEYTSEQPGEQIGDPNAFRNPEHCIYTIFFLVYYINQLNCRLSVDLLCSDVGDKRSLAIEAMSIKVNGQISKRLAKLVNQANNLPKYYDTITEDIDSTRYYMWCNMLYKIAHEIGFEINTAIPQRHLGRPRKNSLTMNNRLLSCTYNTNTFNEPNILQLGSLWYETVLEHDPNKQYHNK